MKKEECENCNGYGIIIGSYDRTLCEDCNGSGFKKMPVTITADGKHVNYPENKVWFTVKDMEASFEAGINYSNDCCCGLCDYCAQKSNNESEFNEWIKLYTKP